MWRLPPELKNASSIIQNCIELTFKGITGVLIFRNGVLVSGTTKEQFEKKISALKSGLSEKNFTNNEKKLNSQPVKSVSFLGDSISKDGIALDHKHVAKIEKWQNQQLTTNYPNHLLAWQFL